MNQNIDEPSLIIQNAPNNPSTFNIITQLIPRPSVQITTQNQNQNCSKIIRNSRIIAAAVKIFISTIALNHYETNCRPDYGRWISTMIIYDVLTIFAQFLKKDPENNNNENNTSSDQGYVLGSNNQGNRASRYEFNGENDEESGLPRSASNGNNNQEENNYFSETCRTILLVRIQSLMTFLYVILFVWGHMMYFANDTHNKHRCPAGLRSLAEIYLVFQWCFFALPLMFVCCCWLSMIFIVLRFRHLLRPGSGQAPARDTIINNLPKQTFPVELQGDPECRICLCDYAEGDDIIKLDCNALHHFHADCITKWLKVNGICPICRKKLEEMNQPAASSAEPSTSLDE